MAVALMMLAIDSNMARDAPNNCNSTGGFIPGCPSKTRRDPVLLPLTLLFHWHESNTNLPVGALGVGQRLTSQPEVTLLKSEAGQELWSLCLELVEVALFDCDR